MDFKKMSFKKIKENIDELHIKEKYKYANVLKYDSRKTVIRFGNAIEKEYENYIAEINRIKKLWSIENKVLDLGYKMIAGIDEVGRGPLAGPVVAAAVILPKNEFIPGINDSKKVSENKRNELFEIIYDKAISIGVGIVDNKTIDKINILNATKLAMKKAIIGLNKKPDFLLIDAVELTDISIRQKNIIKGDSNSISIAAASIIAKVTRDNIVREYAKTYPDFGFETHKGYGTKQHYKALKEHGITPLHRKSFIHSIR